MDREQKRRAAQMTIVQDEDEGQEETDYTIMVSGDCVELHLDHDLPWDNEFGTGPDRQHECWKMSLKTFKRLLKAGQWCVEKSEAFEASHPLVKEG